MPDFNRARAVAERQMKRFGGGIGKLWRAGVSRDVLMVRADYTPKERGLFLDGTERILVSWRANPPPDHEQDLIEFQGKRYRIQAPVTGSRPDGNAIVYDCNVLFQGVV